MPPDFLGIGAQKCGTTWLYRSLSAHPEVWMPKEKELHFWDEKLPEGRPGIGSRLFGNGTQEARWRRQLSRQLHSYRSSLPALAEVRWDLRYFFGETDVDWYERLFQSGEGLVTGEITPNYATLVRNQIHELHKRLPDLRVIFLIRNPIERAWSQLSMKARMGVIGDAKPIDAFSQEVLMREASDDRIERLGDYLTTIDDWLEFFSPERFFVGFLEEIHYASRRLVRELCDFLGIGHPERYPFAQRVVHGSDVETIPTPVAVHLARLNIDLMTELSERLGGHASWWRFTATRLLDDPPNVPALEYPLWRSQLWDDWVEVAPESRAADLTRPLQSGPYGTAAELRSN